MERPLNLIEQKDHLMFIIIKIIQPFEEEQEITNVLSNDDVYLKY